METEVIEYHETMTIGDIIEILPEKNKKHIQQLQIKNYIFIVRIYAPIIDDSLSCSNEDKFINIYYLVWCIKQKLYNK